MATAFQELFGSKKIYIAVRPIPLTSKVTIKPGEEVDEYKIRLFQKRRLYRQRRIGVKGSTWAEAMLKDKRSFAAPEIVVIQQAPSLSPVIQSLIPFIHLIESMTQILVSAENEDVITAVTTLEHTLNQTEEKVTEVTDQVIEPSDEIKQELNDVIAQLTNAYELASDQLETVKKSLEGSEDLDGSGNVQTTWN